MSDPKQVVAAYLAAFSRGDVDGLLAAMTDDASWWVSGSLEGMSGTYEKAPFGELLRGATVLYKEGALKPTPSPVLVRRFSGEGGWHDTLAGILGLTKMDWSNNTLYKKLPVTLVYSKAFADILQQNPMMVDRIYDFRCFM